MWEFFLSFLSKYESLAIWLEGIALVAIFFLDLSEYKRQGKEREEQHTETLEQLRIMEGQYKAATASVAVAQRQADAATENLRLLRAQLLDDHHRELLRAISILDDIRAQVRYWIGISDNKWGSVNQASAILPGDSNVMLVQAGRHSKDLRNQVRETFRMLANADQQIAHFYVQPQNYRQQNLMQAAHGNLVNAVPRLTEIFGAFEQMESALQT